MQGGKRWSEAETKLALYLYFQLPFGKLHSKTPEIIALAERLQRSPSSIAMKLSNFASLDPEITSTGRKGLTGASALDREIWKQFESNWTKLIIEAEQLSANQTPTKTVVDESKNSLADIYYEKSSYLGITELRIGQNFFRKSVLANYDQKCCLTGIDIPSLLTASHIIPWKFDEENRHNPRNGISLSATFDRAFDRGLMTIDHNQKVRFSGRILNNKNPAVSDNFHKYEGTELAIAKKIKPSPEFLKWHYDNVFKT